MNSNISSQRKKPKVSLSSSNLKNLNLDLYEKDFTFVVNGHETKTSKFIADILSPQISRIHRTDPTFDYYEINIKTMNIINNNTKSSDAKDLNSNFDFNKIINMVLNIGSDDELNDDEYLGYEQTFIEEILFQLNSEDFYKVISLFQEQINDSNVFDRIKFKIKNNEYNINNLKDEIDFISKNFYRLDEDKMLQLNLPIIESIVSNRHLIVSSEDSLLEFIFKILHLEEENCNNDERDFYCNENRIQFIHSLFEHVEFIHISDEKICKFIDEFNIEYLTKGTWRSICGRFSSKIIKNDQRIKSSRHLQDDQKMIHQKNINAQNNKNRAIISYLYQKYKNPFEKGIVNVLSSSTYNDSHNSLNATDPNEKSFYLSNDEPNQWFMYDFVQNEVIPHQYSLRSTSGWGSDNENISNWIIEASSDGETWVEIDRHINCQELNGRNITKTFTIENTIRCKCIRIRQIGKNTYNRSYLAFSLFEIYGEII